MKITELYKIYLNHPIISTDSRNIKKDSIFISLKGDNFNGNKYAEQAIKNGSKYAIIDDSSFKKNNNYLLVKDGLKCLQDLAKHHRDQLSIPIIAITGTNGKTTSKELINSCLSTQLKTAATKGNFNNHIGVPLTILGIKKEHQIAVIEIGANHEKEISFLCEIAKPNYGIITNIGRAHLEGFKDTEGVRKTKKELYDYIYKRNGKIFINNNDNILNDISKNINSIKEINSNYISTTINYEEPIDGGESFFDSIIGVTNFLNKNPENIKLRVHNYQMFKRIDSNPPHFSYTLEYQCDNNNYFDFSITVKENPELYKYLLSNCNFLEVLSPLKIRNNLLDKIKSAAKYY